jgi:hypothetical protein
MLLVLLLLVSALCTPTHGALSASDVGLKFFEFMTAHECVLVEELLAESFQFSLFGANNMGFA